MLLVCFRLRGRTGQSLVKVAQRVWLPKSDFLSGQGSIGNLEASCFGCGEACDQFAYPGTELGCLGQQGLLGYSLSTFGTSWLAAQAEASQGALRSQ